MSRTSTAAPAFGDTVTVDTWPGARWRIVRNQPTDEPGTRRMVRLDRSNGRRVELANIPSDRLTVRF